MTRILRFTTFVLLIFLVGCSSLAPLLSTPTPVPALTATPTPQPTPTSTPSAPTTGRRILRVWLPPQFDPNAESPAAEMLNERLTDFEKAHTGLDIEVRIKSETDITGILSVTSNAAPSAMPDLIALSYPNMQIAAATGFLHPLAGLTNLLQDPDWYAFARDLGHYQNTEYGLPFASDALLIVYRPSVFEETPSSWDAIFNSGNQVAFPGSDPRAYFPLSLYVSGRSDLVDETALTQVLSLYQLALETGAVTLPMRDFQTDAQALQTFRDGDADMAVVWASSDIATQSGQYIPLLGLDDSYYSFGSGWVWALAGSSAENQPLATELASYLVESDFISAWNRASNYLPTRPQALDMWDEEDEDLKSSLDEVLQSTHPIPFDDSTIALSSLLPEALISIFNGEQAEVAARSVIEELK